MQAPEDVSKGKIKDRAYLVCLNAPVVKILKILFYWKLEVRDRCIES